MISSKTAIKKEKKANCHIHITGSLTSDDLVKIASTSNINLDSFGSLKDKMSFFNYDIWAAAKEITSSKIGLERSIKVILQKELIDKVTYVELTINPAGMIRRDLNIKDFIYVLESISEYSTNLGIVFKVKLGVNRKDGKEFISIVKKLFEKCPKNIVVAIDLNGDERQFPTEEFKDGFIELGRNGIPTTIHAGEYFGLEDSLLTAISMEPTRIAHALVASNNDKIMESIKKAGVVLEISPLSGFFTEALSSESKYPIRKFLDHKIPLVFGSDDPAIFGKDLSDHFCSFLDCGLGLDEIVQLNKQAFNHLF